MIDDNPVHDIGWIDVAGSFTRNLFIANHLSLTFYSKS